MTAALLVSLLSPAAHVLGFIPEPYELYGVARQETGAVISNGAPIRSFVDGVEYSNKTSVFSRPGQNDGYFDIDTYGNHKTNTSSGSPSTPTIKEGADDNETIMYVWGDMSNNTQIVPGSPWLTGIVFVETHDWQTGLPPQAGDLSAAPMALQPPLVKIYSIVTNSTTGVIPTDYVWLCNPTPNPVDATQFYLEKDVPGSVGGPQVQILTGTIQPYERFFVDTGSVNYFVESGDNVKLVWKNTPGPTAPFGGNDIVVDRVEFNKTAGGSLYWEPGNTIQNDEMAPDRGFQINRTASCRDTNSASRDFYPDPESGRPNNPPRAPWPLTLGTLNSNVNNSAVFHVTTLSGFTIGWLHSDPDLDPQSQADIAISQGPGRTTIVWTTISPGPGQTALYTGGALQTCREYWLSVRTRDGTQYGDLADWRFRTNCMPPPINHVWPSNGMSGVPPGNMVVAWTSVTDPDPGDSVNYTWQVAENDISFTTLHATGTTTNNYSAIFTTNPGQTYYWRVNSSDGWQSNAFTLPWLFMTQSTVVVPPTVNIQSPVGGEDWSGGSVHSVLITMSDESDLQLLVQANYSLDGGADGYPYQIFSGLRDVGQVSLSWSLPVMDSAEMRVEVNVTDSSGLSNVTRSALFIVDSTPPEMVSTLPANGSTEIAIDGIIQITFNETVDRTTAENAFAISPDPGGVSISWNALGGMDIMTVGHGPFDLDTVYVVSFGTALRDDSDPGNVVATALAFSFRTKPPTVYPPNAVAGVKGKAVVGELVTFNGSASTGNITSYNWTIVGSGGNIVATLYGKVVHYTFNVEGMYGITLTVYDAATGLTDQTWVGIGIVPATIPEPGPDYLWLILLLVSTAIILSSSMITEVGRVALLTILVAPVYKRKVKGKEDPETRGMIRGYIRVHPGDTYTDIKKNLGLNNGCLAYHLSRLAKKGAIKSRVQGTRRRYYPAEMQIPVEDGGDLHEIQQQLLKEVRRDPGNSVRILAEQMGVSSQLALYHLRKLSHKGLVVLERRGLQLKVYPPQKKK